MMKRFSFFKKKQIRWIIILLSLGIAVFLVWPASIFETDIFIPVKLENIPDGLTVSPPFPKGIEIRVSGPKSSVQSLMNHSLVYPLDLSGADARDLTIPIHTDVISLPTDITIKKISPSFLTVYIEKEKIKIIPISPSISGKPAAGHIISTIKATPSSVTLKGPTSLLEPIKHVQTKPVDVNGAVESFKKETTLELAEGIQIISPLETILVDITIQEKIDIREFQGMPVKGLHTNYPYHISPASIDIKVKGPANALDKPDIAESVNVHIDLKGLKPGIYMKPATILLPVNIILIHVEPEIFTVEIEDQPDTSK